jgi:branched-chain amino acid transport system substrate-binding protein
MKLQKNYFVLIAVALFLVFSPFMGRVYSADTIKVGFVAPLTGSFADDGSEMLRGVRMMVDERNARGGLLGKKLEIIKGDIGDFSAEKIVSVGEKLVHRDKVDCLITQYLGGVVDVKTYGEYDVPYLNQDTAQSESDLIRENLEKYSNVFQTCPPESKYAPGIFDFIDRVFPAATGYKYPNKKIALVTMVRAFNDRISARFTQLAKKSDWELVVDEKTPSGTIEWGAVLAKIRQTNPAVIFFNDHIPTDDVAFLEQFHNNPTKSLIFIMYGPSNPAFVQLAKKNANDIFWGTTLAVIGEKGKAWRERYKTKYNEEAGFGTAAGTYLSSSIWAAAVEKVRDPKNYKEVCRVIRENIWNFIGTNVVFNPDDQTVITGEGLSPLVYLQVQNLKHTVVSPLAHADAKIQVPAWMK